MSKSKYVSGSETRTSVSVCMHFQQNYNGVDQAVSLVDKRLMSNSFSECCTEQTCVYPRSSMFCKFHSFLFELYFKVPVLTTVMNNGMKLCLLLNLKL